MDINDFYPNSNFSFDSGKVANQFGELMGNYYNRPLEKHADINEQFIKVANEILSRYSEYDDTWNPKLLYKF